MRMMLLVIALVGCEPDDGIGPWVGEYSVTWTCETATCPASDVTMATTVGIEAGHPPPNGFDPVNPVDLIAYCDPGLVTFLAVDVVDGRLVARLQGAVPYERTADGFTGWMVVTDQASGAEGTYRIDAVKVADVPACKLP